MCMVSNPQYTDNFFLESCIKSQFVTNILGRVQSGEKVQMIAAPSKLCLFELGLGFVLAIVAKACFGNFQALQVGTKPVGD